MSKPAKTAVSDAAGAEETAVSSLYPGMQVLTLKGVEGVALVPDEDNHLSAAAINRFIRRQNTPDELEQAAAVFKEFYARSALVDFRFQELKITDDMMINLEYPAELAYWTFYATEPHLNRIFSKKK